MQADFVKASTTTVPADESQGSIIAMLHRYGASGFGFRKRGEIVEVTFHIQRGAEEDTVRIPVDVARIHEKLNTLQGQRVKAGRHVAKTVSRDQAERVAWRILLLWIEAALSAVSLGAQTLEEAFFAHLVVRTADGQEGRVVDYIHTISGGADRRLPAPGRMIDGTRALSSG